MSKDMAANLLIGPVQMYWNDIRLGSEKSSATIRYSAETVQIKDEETGQSIISRKVGEMCEVDLTLAEFDLAQMRYVFAQANSRLSATTLNTTNYETNTSTIFRFREDVTFAGTASVTLAQAGFIASTIKVYKCDYTNAPDGYTSSTDFTSSSAAGTIARLAGGDIADKATVYVEYNMTATSTVISVGGELADFEAALRLVHETDDGKVLQFLGYRAKKIGASDVAINMASEFGGVPMTFHLADKSKTPGKQMFEWAKED
jgi:hypothetical protein